MSRVKEIKLKKDSIRKIILILLSVILLLILITFGFTFFSMQNSNPYVAMFIDFEGNEMGEKSNTGFPNRDGDLIGYDFQVIMEKYTENDQGYILQGVPYNYQNYFDNIEDAKFEYYLSKSKGDFDFSEIEGVYPLKVTLTYKVEKNIRFFLEYSLCSIKRAYSNLFNIDNPCARGNCLIKRSVDSWSIESMKKEMGEKEEFFESYDRDSLVRGLFNFFIINDFGYFTQNVYKTISTQIARANGTFQFDSKFTKNTETNDDLFLFWMLAGVSDMYKKNYEEQESIDLEAYMGNIVSYWNQTDYKSYLSCEMSYRIVDNLQECTSDTCNTVKESAYEYCKQVLGREMEGYFTGSTIPRLPSELVFFNKTAKLMGKESEMYSESDVLKYFNEINSLYNINSDVIDNCYLLKGINEIYSEYSKDSYRITQESVYSRIPDLNTICSGFVVSNYCVENIANRLICVDAISNTDKESAKEVMYDIFYRYYSGSPISNKMTTMEKKREWPKELQNTDGIKLDEYGYFVYKIESKTDEGVDVSSTAQLFDSYYFIYILSKIGNEE